MHSFWCILYTNLSLFIFKNLNWSIHPKRTVMNVCFVLLCPLVALKSFNSKYAVSISTTLFLLSTLSQCSAVYVVSFIPIA